MQKTHTTPRLTCAPAESPNQTCTHYMNTDIAPAGGELLPRLLTARDVAALLQVPRRTVYALVDQGFLPVRRIGKRLVRFARADIEAVVEAGKREPVR